MQTRFLVTDNDLSALPRQYFTHVLAERVLECIPRSASAGVLLDLADLTVGDGHLEVSTVSLLGVADLMKGGSFAEQHAQAARLFGAQAASSDLHHAAFTESTLTTVIISTGYTAESLRVEDEWRFRVEAKKSSDWSALARVHISQDDFIKQAFQSALFRDPDPTGEEWAYEQLRLGEPRRDVLRHLYASEERLFKVAGRNHL